MEERLHARYTKPAAGSGASTTQRCTRHMFAQNPAPLQAKLVNAASRRHEHSFAGPLNRPQSPMKPQFLQPQITGASHFDTGKLI